MMRVSPLAAALLLAACTPPPPPGAAPAHALRELSALDQARIYRAALADESDPLPRRAGLARRRILGENLGDGGLLPDSVVSQLLQWGLFSAVCEDGERGGTAPECASRPLMVSRQFRVNRDTVDVYLTSRPGESVANWSVTRCRVAYAAGRWTRTQKCETRLLI